MDQFSVNFEKYLTQYRVHLLFFLVAFFIAITLAHPSFFVNDEWITANQLSQLHDGRQLMFNEGKYGSYDNGTASYYFIKKNNILGYSLFLPLISLPAYWLLDLAGNNCVFFLIYLWTFLLIIIALFVNRYFPAHAYYGKWRWTSGMIVGAFVLFFLNFYYYQPFFITGEASFPEILSIVFTHMLLFAFLSVIVYEINRTVFSDTAYSIFGTIVCLSCSSYLFWTNFCKDHLLVAFLFAIIVLLVVKFFQENSVKYFCGAFAFSGLLAWGRPELALFVCISICILAVWTYFSQRDPALLQSDRKLLIISPIFTLLGAVPFFINNYLFTRNIFVPTSVLWKTSEPVISSAADGSANLTTGTPDMIGSMISIIIAGINTRPATFFADFYGIFFNPQNGAIGLFPIMPLVLIGIVLLPLLIIKEHVHFTTKEKYYLGAMFILSFGVIVAYFGDLHGLNTSVGINPDMRYLSPLYLPLNIIALIVLAKVPDITGKTIDILKWMVAAWLIIIPASLLAMARYYPFPELFADLFPLLHLWFSIGVYFMTILFIVSISYCLIFKKTNNIPILFLAILCALPIIWQIDATYLMRYYGTGFGGYSFWIPVMLKFFGLIF
jgi:hypothetical protein